MLKNYLKIAFRNLTGQKLFSLINVFGLAIGIATCMVINFWVQNEISYDRFHKNAHRIYRVERELFRDNFYSRWPITSGLYKEALISDYPEIENAVRIWRREFSIKDHKNFVNREGLFAADNSIFEIFDFGLEKGDEKSALTEPKTVVLTRENAKKFLGTDDAIGKSISFEWQGEQVDFKVTGILKEVPKNSHIQFDMLISISSYPKDRFNSWRSNYLYTYVLVEKTTSRNELEGKLKSFVNQRLEPYYGDLTGAGANIHDVLKMELFPITDIHLHPSVNWELESGGNIISVYIFSSIAILILLVACINFINLSTARANKRAKEVSLRKTVGALRNQLRGQFIYESVLMAVVALALAIVFISIFIQVYNSIFEEELSLRLLLQVQNVFILLGITLGVGFFAGLYPAVYLTKFEPIKVIKGGFKPGSGKSAFRRNMVVIQFIISITLIIGMLTVYKQMMYIQTRSLGYDKENMVVIPVRSQQVAQSYDAFRNKLMQNSQIESVAASSDIPSDTYYSNGSFFDKKRPNNAINLIVMTGDFDYVDTYKIDILAGRGFSRDFSSDTSGTILLNEAAAQRIGWTPEEAVGRELRGGGSNNATKIVGVVKNFNFKSVRTEIEPMALLLFPNYITYISVRILPNNIGETLNIIKEKWQETFLEEQFGYSFLNNRLNEFYESEQKMQNIFTVFSGLSIFVACLGLFGLSVFTAEVRTKEIGIRKALGASTGTVIFLFSKEFIKWIILANIIAWPLAWYFMDKWLQNFVYKINIGWSVFIFSGIITLSIALLTFIFQAFKSAMANPVDALRYE